MFYDRAGHVENRLRRAIVLFQPDGLRIGKILFEIQDVGNVGAAPLVDRLIFVAHDADVLLLLGQQTNQGKLQRVCVLVFIDQDVAKLVVVLFAHLGDFPQQSHGFDQQIVEVERVVGVQSFFVHLVNTGYGSAALVDVIGAGSKCVDVFAAVFGGADGALRGAQSQLLLVVAEVLDAVLDQPGRVVLVVDGKPARVFLV